MKKGSGTRLPRKRAWVRLLLLVVPAVAWAVIFLLPRRQAARADEGGGEPRARYEEIGSDGTLVKLYIKRSTEPTYADVPPAVVEIAAGGYDTPVHKADFKVTFEPALSPGTTVSISLADGGEGFEPSSWWWSWFVSGRKRATLTIGSQTYLAGETTNPLTYTSPAEINGTLLSSNAKEFTKIVVSVGSPVNVTLNGLLDFAGGDVNVNLGDGTFSYDTWTSFTISRSLGGSPIASHITCLVISKVYLADGTVLSADLGADQGGSTALDDYVYLDQSAYLDHSYQEVTTNAGGSATAEYKVVDQDVSSFEVRANDMDVAVDAEE